MSSWGKMRRQDQTRKKKKRSPKKCRFIWMFLNDKKISEKKIQVIIIIITIIITIIIIVIVSITIVNINLVNQYGE